MASGPRLQKVAQWPGYHRGDAMDVVAADGLAFVAAGSGGLQVWNLNDTQRGTPIANLTTIKNTYGLAWNAGVLFLVDGNAGLLSVDVARPIEPRVMGRSDPPTYAWTVKIVGALAFVGGGDGLNIFDISKPSSLLEVGMLSGFRCEDLEVRDSVVFTVGPDGVRAIDVSNPAAPREVSRAEDGITHYGLGLNGNALYLADFNYALTTYDVSNRTLVRRNRRAIRRQAYARDFAILNNLLFSAKYDLATNGSFVSIFDITQPFEPKWVGDTEVNRNISRLCIDHDRLFVAAGRGGLQVFELTQPSKPAFVRSFPTAGQALGVAGEGDAVFLTEDTDEVLQLDLADPTAPKLAARHPFESLPFGTANSTTAVQGDIGFQIVRSNLQYHLVFYTLTDPRTPSEVSSLQFSGIPYLVRINGQRAYAAGAAGIWIIDLSDVTTPRVLGTFSPPTGFDSFDIRKTTAVAVDFKGMVSVIDLAQPEKPQVLAQIPLDFGTESAVHIEGKLCFIARYNSFWVLDLTNPAAPVVLEKTDDGGLPNWITKSGNLIFVADRISGLRVLTWGRPQTIQFVPPLRPIKVGEKIRLEAIASSGLPVSFRLQEGVAHLEDGWLDSTQVGAVVVRAYQPGSTDFAPAFATQRFDIVAATLPRLGVSERRPDSLVVRIEHTPNGLVRVQQCSALGPPSSWTDLLQTNSPTGVIEYAVPVQKISSRFLRVVETPP